MKINIEKIQLKELKDFVESKTFRQLEYVPITPARVESYLHNPNSKPDDVVLYLGFFEGQLIAYRSLFAGKIQTKNQTHRFGWCSGNWVHPRFRRKGYSRQLLQSAYSDWKGKLMFTNYAGESEKLYLQSGWFMAIHQFKGTRAYLFPQTRKLLPYAKKHPHLSLLWKLIDGITGLLSHIRMLFFAPERHRRLTFQTMTYPDEECYRLAEKTREHFLFKRGEAELKWIFHYPWIAEINRPYEKKYPFSACASPFYYKTIKVFQENKFEGFLIFSVREGHLKMLFCLIPEILEEETARFLKNYCVQNKLEMITVYNKGIAHRLFARKFPFLHAKPFGQKIYSSFTIEGLESYQFQDGEGDAIFT